VKAERAASAAAFLDAAGGFLMADEVRNNALLSVARAVHEGSRPTPEPPLFAVMREAGGIVACALRTPPFRLLVSDGPAAAWDALARALQAEHAVLPGVSGPREAAAAFAQAWAARSGCATRISARLRLHQLAAVADDLPAVPGELTPAGEADRALAVDWFEAFHREATPDAPNEAAAAVERFMRAARLFLWRDQVPVALAGVVGQTDNGVRIGPVYTPPAQRGRGYATAAVAALSRRLLTRNAYCALYTDLANPTSNRIYARIGYRPVADFDEFAFD
jgi:predicted GNAT family acetyltransferase